MKLHARLVILALCSLFVTCLSSCTDIKKTKFTVENRDKILSKLTPEERELLTASLMRQSMANIFGGSSNPIPDKTVGELIEDQRKWLAQQKAEEDRQKRLAEEMAAKEAALRNIITVALYGYQQKDGGFMGNYVAVDYAYENRSSKDVRAFEGRVVYRDVLGNELADTDLKVLAPIKSGQKASTSDRLPFIAYSGLRDKKREDVKIEWNPTKILFDNGTSETIPSK
jgi:hypothetical protein